MSSARIGKGAKGRPHAGSADLLHLACDLSELSGTTNGSTVTPAASSFGTAGTLVVVGSGAVIFSAGPVGDGVKFTLGNQQNSNIAYYKWTGAGIGDVFTAGAGEIRFYLTSSYSWADRQALGLIRHRYVYDVYDGNGPQWNFNVTVFDSAPNRLKIIWGLQGYGTEYDIPSGDEDAIFGLGVTMLVRITWDGSTTARLYLNSVLVQTLPYTPVSANWNSSAVAIVGAQRNPEGFFCCDDQLDDLRVLRVA